MVRSFKVVYGQRLSADEYRLLREVLEVDGLEASEFIFEAARALTAGEIALQASRD